MVWLFAFNELILQHHIQMTQQKKSDVLLAAIREGKPLVSAEKLNLIIGLSVPSILAQVTSVLMFFSPAHSLTFGLSKSGSSPFRLYW